VLQDLRFALRIFGRARGLAAVAILAIALGIGANTAIFSVVNAVLLTPLPYRDSGRLVLVQERIPQVSSTFFSVSAPDVLDMQRWTKDLDAVAAFNECQMNLAGQMQPKRISGARVSWNLFPMLGASPQLGRTFTREEDSPGHPVTILSHALWQDRFGADPSVVGSKVLLDGVPYDVIGVMPRGFGFPPSGTPNSNRAATDFWIPMAFTKEELADVVDNFDIGVLGHMKPGTSQKQVAADMNHLARLIQDKYPEAYQHGFSLDVRATPFNELITGPSRPVLLLLLGAVGFVLLIACANVANLLLSHALGRQREIAIRAALGAAQGRLVRQMLTESLLLALTGGVLGVTVAWIGLNGFVAMLPASIPHPGAITLDWRVLSFAASLSILTGLIFGSLPSLGGGRVDVTQALNETSRASTAGVRRTRLKKALAVCNIAVSLVLLMGAGLLIRSYGNALRADPGFNPSNVISFTLALPEKQYASDSKILSFDRDLSSKLEAIPGVRTVGAGNFLPLFASYWNRTFVPEGWSAPGGKVPLCDFTPVFGSYLQALGIPLLRGRYFTDYDRKGGAPVVIVSANLAQRYWPNQNPVGKRLRYGGLDSKEPWSTVVGVVADAKLSSLQEEPSIRSYRPVEQLEGSARTAVFFAIRANGNPGALGSSVRTAVTSLDPDLPISQMRTMTEVVGESMKPQRFNTLLLGIFAALALFLSVLGVYSVMAFAVVQRTQEIGIRMAMGARLANVLTMLLREVLVLGLAGIAIGALASLALGRYISGLLYGVQPTDALTLAAAATLLILATLLATYLPARRAAKLDPMLALRHQ